MATAYRYWRYKCTRWQNLGAAGTSDYNRISELQFLTSAAVVYPTSAMTSATTPAPFVITESGHYDTNDGWKAFDRVLDDAHRYMSGGDGTSHLTADMGTAIVFTKVKIAPDGGASSNYTPLDFVIQASNTAPGSGGFSGEEVTMLSIANASTG